MGDGSTDGAITDDKTAATVFEWNAELNTLVVADDENNRAFGAGKTATYMNFSAFDSKQSDYNWGQFTETSATNPSITIYNNPTDIVNELYKLQPGESLSGGHKYTLTGVISEITDPYSDQYKNITVIIVVNNMEDKPVTVFRVKGEGADTIKVGDTITVSGTLTNYGGTFEFNSGCTLDAVN